jgi:protein-L-isoaspartate(D-aspartate) O-methyltransferase
MDPERTERIKRLLRELNESGIRDRDVLTAIAAVPREHFVPERLLPQAWENRALPIEERQTISQPLIVGLMTQALRLTGTDQVLEIGTGSGYQAAILSRLAKSVVSVERYPNLAEQARARLERLECDNVTVVVGDGTKGWPPGAPYDRIIVTAAAPHLPGPLLEQLVQKDGARIVIPIGSSEEQELIAYERVGDRLRDLRLGPVRFVLLIGAEGWQERDR